MSSPLASLERVLRIAVAVLALTVAVLVNVRAHAAEQWTQVATVEEVAIRVSQVTEAELARLRAKHEPSDRSALGRVVPMHRYGFALLMRDRSTGAYRCEVYVIDAGDSQTLEHETRHCHGWVHP